MKLTIKQFKKVINEVLQEENQNNNPMPKNIKEIIKLRDDLTNLWDKLDKQGDNSDFINRAAYFLAKAITNLDEWLEVVQSDV